MSESLINDMINNAPSVEPDEILTTASDEQLLFMIRETLDELSRRPHIDLVRVYNSIERKLYE